MKTIKTSFDEMLASTSSAIQQEVSLEFTISNRIYELMTERSLSRLQFTDLNIFYIKHSHFS
ncbi:hypothetical protein AB9N12_06770 [Bacteroides sp. AN502(2024)]|uniref:hypothetical protein n=1 Tax=Bacteroides sp. AN502(2024) TaxID=3160599 RepID=UPI003518F6A9